MNKMQEKLGLKDMDMLKKDENFMNPEGYSQKVVKMSGKLDWSASPNVLKAEKLAIQNRSNRPDFSMKLGLTGSKSFDMGFGKQPNKPNFVVPKMSGFKSGNAKAGMLSMHTGSSKPKMNFNIGNSLKAIPSLNPFSKVDKKTASILGQTPKNSPSLKKKVGVSSFDKKIDDTIGFKAKKTAWNRLSLQKGLKPFGDQDGDKLANILDCVPNNYFKQDYENIKKALKNKGIEPDTVDWDSIPDDANVEDFLMNEYGYNLFDIESQRTARQAFQSSTPEERKEVRDEMKMMKMTNVAQVAEIVKGLPKPKEEEEKEEIDYGEPSGGFLPLDKVNPVETYNAPTAYERTKAGAKKLWTGAKKLSEKTGEVGDKGLGVVSKVYQGAKKEAMDIQAARPVRGKPDIVQSAETSALKYMVKTMIRQREKDKYGFGSKAKGKAKLLAGEGSSASKPFGSSAGLISAAGQGGAISRAENIARLSSAGRGGLNMMPQGTGSGFLNMLGGQAQQQQQFEQVQFTQEPQPQYAPQGQPQPQRPTYTRTTTRGSRPPSPEGYTYSPYSNRPVTYIRGPYKRKFATDNQPPLQAYPMPPQQ